MRAKDKSLEKKYYSRDVAWEQEKRKTENSVHVSLLRTRLKLEDAVRKVDNRSEWRTTIHGVVLWLTLGVRTAKGKARRGKALHKQYTLSKRL